MATTKTETQTTLPVTPPALSARQKKRQRQKAAKKKAAEAATAKAAAEAEAEAEAHRAHQAALHKKINLGLMKRQSKPQGLDLREEMQKLAREGKHADARRIFEQAQSQGLLRDWARAAALERDVLSHVKPPPTGSL